MTLLRSKYIYRTNAEQNIFINSIYFDNKVGKFKIGDEVFEQNIKGFVSTCTHNTEKCTCQALKKWLASKQRDHADHINKGEFFVEMNKFKNWYESSHMDPTHKNFCPCKGNPSHCCDNIDNYTET